MSRPGYHKEWREKNKEKSREYSKKWRSKNLEKVSASAAEWKKRNPEKVKELKAAFVKNMGEESRVKARASKAKYREANKEILNERAKGRRERMRGDPVDWSKRRAASIRSRCKKSGVPCSVTWEDVLSLLPEDLICPVLGIKMKLDGGINHSSATIDRTIPSLGYIRGNMCVISARANLIKQNVTDFQEIMKVANWMEQRIK